MTGERHRAARALRHGVVYRAKDLKPWREVALKLLPDGFGTLSVIIP